MTDQTLQAATIDIEAVLTEPMRVKTLARHFRVEAHKMRKILDRIPGAQKLGSMWRVPVVKMPAEYLVRRGLIQPAAGPIDGIRWNQRENSPLTTCKSVLG